MVGAIYLAPTISSSLGVVEDFEPLLEPTKRNLEFNLTKK